MTAQQRGISACFLAVVLLGMSLAGGGVRSAELSPASAAVPAVSGAWVRLPAVAGRPGAGYLTVKARAGDALVGVDSPLAERIELHSMAMDGGVMRMRAEPALVVPASGQLVLASGGNHLMLFGLSPSVRAGRRLPLTLRFRSGATVETMAEARLPGDAAKASVHRH
jgi:hypothetical protein